MRTSNPTEVEGAFEEGAEEHMWFWFWKNGPMRSLIICTFHCAILG
jgi:hypothetical protein